MKDSLTILIVAVAILVFTSGVSQFSEGKTIMRDSLIPCCNQSMCEQPVHYCDEESSVITVDDCVSRTVTCCQCVELTARGCLCSGPGSTYCYNRDGTKYYGHDGQCVDFPLCTQSKRP